MRVYVGRTHSKPLIAELESHGIGECTNRGELGLKGPLRLPWFLDNGAFGDWRRGREFDARKYLVDLGKLARHPVPAFIVAPDVVAGGEASMALSLSWLDRIEAASPAAVYLAVQDGMTEALVAANVARFSGLFVGGTTGWKVATGGDWVAMAHALGKPCHIGRVGVPDRVRWAKRVRADSIDSSFPLWTKERMRGFLAAVNGTDAQMEMWS